jgi:hypothetical protein
MLAGMMRDWIEQAEYGTIESYNVLPPEMEVL